LFDELDQGVGRRLTLVVGAAGAGKTTLLANWLSARPDVPSAWLSCDTGDSDPVRFYHALIRAMSSGFDDPGIGENARELLSLEGEASFDVVGALVDDLEGLAGPRVVVVDDFHLVGPESATFGHFLESRPLSVQVVVATRSDPPLRLHRLRMREELVEVRDPDLAFSAVETKGLFAAFGLELPDDDIQAVHRRTEGWSAGLQMAALSIQASPDPVTSVRQAEIDSTTVAGYFLDEVLDRQPQAIVDFMLASSVLDELSPAACAGVIGPGAAAILDYLSNAHLFVTVVDEVTGTFRYHHLIREVLQAELHRRNPTLEASLHEAAARYFLDAGHAGAAARHLLAAGDSSTAFRLLSDRVVRDVLTHPTLESALDLDELRPELFTDVPEVLVPLAAELLWRGSFERGARAVALARQSTVDPTRDAALAVRFALVNTLYCTFVGEFDEALESRAWSRSFETTATGVGDWIVSLDALAMYCQTYVGGFREARLLAKALVDGGSSVPLADLLCPGVMSQAAFLEGKLDEAAALAEAALHAARRLRFERHYFAFHHLRTLGQLALERRDLQGAIEPVEVALGMVSRARPAFNFLAQLDRARIWAAGGHREEALASLPAARSALQSRQSVLLAEADELEARLRFSLGDPLRARRIAERLPPARRAVVDAIMALAAGDDTKAEHALGSSALTSSTLRTNVELQLIRANIALVARRPEATRLVRTTLDAAQRHGFLHTVLDTAPLLVEDVVSRPHLYPERANLGPLLSAYHDADDLQALPGGRPRQTAVVEPLTKMEIRVLTRLADHLSYREIASDLYVSVNTVKTHISHVYYKLGVSSRSSAISRAATLGLLGR
jgi:LuxR family maltose regulon positive regulatory protein